MEKNELIAYCRYINSQVTLTGHAIQRWSERGKDEDIYSVLGEAVPYAGQYGDEMLLINDEHVFVIAKRKEDGKKICLTVLQIDQAIASMQQVGISVLLQQDQVPVNDMPDRELRDITDFERREINDIINAATNIKNLLDLEKLKKYKERIRSFLCAEYRLPRKSEDHVQATLKRLKRFEEVIVASEQMKYLTTAIKEILSHKLVSKIKAKAEELEKEEKEEKAKV